MKKKYWFLYYIDTSNYLASDGLLSAVNCKTVVVLTCIIELTTGSNFNYRKGLIFTFIASPSLDSLSLSLFLVLVFANKY